MKLPEGEYCLYLRKSRADLEAEARGEGETLAKHKKHLLALAKSSGINITHIYHEIVSGDRISDRPEAMKLLSDVEEGRWKGVLVMEVERLARGDTIDQGLVAQAFKRSSTLIVTPIKTYDPNNEFDEEYFEFGLFMARREYKTIKRRLMRGREASASDGKYIGTRPPYGYKITYNDKGERFLEPHPEQADIVRMIFQWYDSGVDFGATRIAFKLQQLGIETYRGSTEWSVNVILQMLRNEVYVGKIQWKKTDRRKSVNAMRKYDIKQREKTEWISVPGKHQSLVDEELFERVQQKLRENLTVPVKKGARITNPLAGVIKCGKCGKAIVLKPFPKRRGPGYTIACNNKYCDCKGSNYDVVEDRLVATLRAWIKQQKLDLGKRKQIGDSGIVAREKLVTELKREAMTLNNQKMSLHDYLERKIYDEETFLERSKLLSERIVTVQQQIIEAEKELLEEQSRKVKRVEFIPTMQQVLDLFVRSKDPANKNALIKQIVSKVTYTKEKHQQGDDFELVVTPKIPKG